MTIQIETVTLHDGSKIDVIRDIEAVKKLQASHERLAQEVEELREDKARLDWLEKAKCAYYHEGPCCWRINEDDATDSDCLRAAIDAAMSAGFKPSNDGGKQP